MKNKKQLAWDKVNEYSKKITKVNEYRISKKEFNYIYDKLGVKNITEIKAWANQKAWQGYNKNKIREGQEVNATEYLSARRGEGKFNREYFRAQQKYQMSDETFKAASMAHEIATGKKLAYKYRANSTQEIADLMLDDIKQKKDEEIIEGMNSGLDYKQANKRANKLISYYFFGS